MQSDTPPQARAETLADKKVAILPKLLDVKTVAAAAQAAADSYAAREIQTLSLAISEAERAFFQRRTIPLAPLDWGRALVETVRTHPVVLSIASAYLGKAPSALPDSFIREVYPERLVGHLPFHQDQTICGHPLVNIWIALSPCGRDAPGIQFVTGSRELLEPIGNPEDPVAVERARLDENTVIERFGAQALWTPEFEAGDGAIFFGTTIHRTLSRPQMSLPRMSAEIRLA